MKYILLIISLTFMIISCEETEPDIISNPDATSSFEECIPLSFQFSAKIEIDTSLVLEIQEALRLARTVDIKLHEIVPYNFGCVGYNVLDIRFRHQLDSMRIVDSCLTGYLGVDSLILQYGFDSCDSPNGMQWAENEYGYTFYTEQYLNLNILGALLMEEDDVVYAGYQLVDCDCDIWCEGVSLSILSDIYTFKFHSWCSESTTTQWIVVVYNGEATLISKTG